MNRTHRPRAFSLLETLIALGLIIALLGALFAFFWDTLRARERIIEESHRQRAASILIDGIERDLMTCIVGDGVTGPGVNGDETSLALFCRSVPVRLVERGAQDGTILADLERADYRFDERSGRIAVGRSLVEEATGRLFSLEGEIHQVRFRYHDGKGWQETFNSLNADRLPVAVEIAIWFDPWPGAEPAADRAILEDEQIAPDRTFDPEGGFDERDFMDLSETDIEIPPPDRLRILAIPDAAPPETSGEDSEELP